MLLVQQMDGLDYDAFNHELIRQISIECGFDKKVFKDSQLSELSQLLSVQIHTLV